ncbi:MAG: hypothetical protein MK172_05545 [Verrucomicrobiales bacterium]|nr:hypothetical protein [Verrucomicrobiales bacterium]
MLLASPPESTVAPQFFRDLCEGFEQQMFFWGRDVIHPECNLLVAEGFERIQSKGKGGTSCYRRPWQNGHIELYGSCAGWYGHGNGFTFIRPRKRCVIWLSEEVPPIPSAWQGELIHRATSTEELYLASIPFLDWLISYERAVLNHFGSAYRMQNYKDYKKLPMAKAWIKPPVALRWFRCFRENPEKLIRARKLSQNTHLRF